MPETASGMRNVKFFRLHHRLLAFFSALIVFTTFVLKDQIQEPWKKKAEHLEVLQEFMELQMATIEHSAEPSKEEGVSELFQTTSAKEQDALETLEISKPLAVELDDADINRQVVESAQFDQALRDAVSDYYNRRLKFKKYDDRSPYEVDIRLVQLQQHVSKLEGACDSAAREQRSGLEQKSKWAGFWSVVSYTIGWLLGLLGKVFGDDEFVEVEPTAG